MTMIIGKKKKNIIDWKFIWFRNDMHFTFCLILLSYQSNEFIFFLKMRQRSYNILDKTVLLVCWTFLEKKIEVMQILPQPT